jgi:hypothetical protein
MFSEKEEAKQSSTKATHVGSNGAMPSEHRGKPFLCVIHDDESKIEIQTGKTHLRRS